MRLLALTALLYVASAALGLLADVSPAASEVAPWAQLGTAGVLAWVVSLLVGELRAARTDGAKQREEHAVAVKAGQEDSAKQREDHNAAFEKSNQRWQEQADKDRAVMVEMVRTCSGNRQAALADAAKNKGKPGG
jgi:hypothetical protein